MAVLCKEIHWKGKGDLKLWSYGMFLCSSQY